VFIHPPNQQSDKGIAAALQFCDSRRGEYKRALAGIFTVPRHALSSVTSLSCEHRKE
jgi:hypothetical protein